MKPEIPDIYHSDDFYCALSMDSLGRIDQESRSLLARKSQEIFKNWLLRQLVVFGWIAHRDQEIWHPKETCYDDKPTHLAFVVCPTDIRSENCEHAPEVIKTINFKPIIEEKPSCYKCGKKLKAIWKEL